MNGGREKAGGGWLGSFVKVTMAACSAFILHHFEQYFRVQALQEEAATKIHSECHCGLCRQYCVWARMCVLTEKMHLLLPFLNKCASPFCELTRCQNLCLRCSSSPKFPSCIFITSQLADIAYLTSICTASTLTQVLFLWTDATFLRQTDAPSELHMITSTATHSLCQPQTCLL